MILDNLRKSFFHLRNSGFKGLIKFLKLNKFENDLFKAKKLNWNNLGYWEINPKPLAEDLIKFYTEVYWLNNRVYKNNLLLTRDIDHFQFLKDKVPTKIKDKSIFLNYGAGHGGVSYLANAAKMDVINIEPADVYKGKIDNFYNYKKLEDYIDKNKNLKKIDVLYSSHTVEHLNDPIELFKTILPMMDKLGIVIIEVPNCRIKNPDKNYHEGGCDGKITGSHILYFTKDFFEKITDKVYFFSNQIIENQSIEVFDENEADCLRVIMTKNEIENFISKKFS